MSIWTGEALQDLRYELGKTVGEMADLLAVHERTLRDYEKGQRPIGVPVGMLAAALAEGWLTEPQLIELRRQVEHWDPEAELPGPRRTPEEVEEVEEAWIPERGYVRGRGGRGREAGERTPDMPDAVFKRCAEELLATMPEEAREAVSARLQKQHRGRRATLAREEARRKRLAAQREAAEALLR